MDSRRAAVTSVAGVLAVVLVVLASVWAASVGPAALLTGDGIDPPEVSVSTPSLAGDPGEQEALERAARDREGWGWVRPVAYVVEALLVLALLFALGWAARRAALALRERLRERRARGRPEPPPDIDFTTVDDRAALAAALAERAVGRERLLGGGAPANAIVAAWADFEDTAAGVGLLRSPWQTEAEFVLEVLDSVGADEAAVQRLSELYREARYSDHPLDEHHRTAARAALAAVHASLGRRPADLPGGAR